MRSRRGVAAPWLIGLVAVGCGVWAVVDFVGAAQPDEPTAMARTVPVTPVARGRAAELHRLLADGDGLDDVGALVSVHGTVVGAARGDGFWVRDLRDNVVWVVSTARPHAGAAVRVTGRLDRMDAGARPEPAPPGAGTLVRDVRVLADGPAAVEVLPD